MVPTCLLLLDISCSCFECLFKLALEVCFEMVLRVMGFPILLLCSIYICRLLLLSFLQKDMLPLLLEEYFDFLFHKVVVQAIRFVITLFSLVSSTILIPLWCIVSVDGECHPPFSFTLFVGSGALHVRPSASFVA